MVNLCVDLSDGLVQPKDLEDQVLAEALDSANLIVFEVFVPVHLTRVREHQERLVRFKEVVSSLRWRYHFLADEERLDVFTLSAPNALIFKVPKQVVVSSLLYMFFVYCPHICQPLEETAHCILEYLCCRPSSPDFGLFKELKLLQEGMVLHKCHG